MEIKTFTVNDLKAALISEDFWQTSTLPITKHRALSYCRNPRADADDPVAKKIFREISEEEKFHFDLLQAQYDSVTRSGFWLGSAEFQMDGKW